MSEIFKPVSNETATDRNPWDELSPESSAMDNPFETNPNDSVDITGEYDDSKAQEIEQTLEPTLDAESDIAGETAEVELTPKDYEDFANSYLAELFTALDNPANSDAANQEAITDQIAVAASLFDRFQNEDPSNPGEVFQHITATYDHLAELAQQNHQTRIAETHHRHAAAVARTADNFKSYIAANKTPQPETTPNSEDNFNSLPDDVIQ